MVRHFCTRIKCSSVGLKCAEQQQHQRQEEGSCSGQCWHMQTAGSITAMVEEAETEGCVSEVVALHVVLLDRVIDVVGQAQILCCRPTAFVLVSGNVCAKAERTETVAGYGLLGAASLGHFHANVVALGTLFAQEADAAPVEVVGAAGRGGSAAITPNCSTCPQQIFN